MQIVSMRSVHFCAIDSSRFRRIVGAYARANATEVWAAFRKRRGRSPCIGALLNSSNACGLTLTVGTFYIDRNRIQICGSMTPQSPQGSQGAVPVRSIGSAFLEI
jgi:hypothetical protein